MSGEEGVNVKTFWASFFCEGDVNVEASRVVTSASRQSSLEGQQFWRCWCVGMSRVRELLTSKGAERASRVEAKIGRASCRERVWQYVENSVVVVKLKKK